MTTTAASTPSPKRKSWLRRLAWLSAMLLVLLVVSYFVVTSAAFLKGVILPKVSQAMNAKVTVTDASIRPFSTLILKGVAVQTLGPDPAITMEEVRLRYSLTSILGGTIKVDEVALVNPTIRIEQNSDGTSNLDPITKRSGTKPAAQPQPPSGSSPTPNVDIGKVTLSDGSVQVIQKLADGVETRIKLEKLNFALTDVRNGQTARMTLNGVGQWYSGTSVSNSSASIDLKTELNVGLTPSLGLGMVKGEVAVSIGGATGAFAQLSGIRTGVECDITPSEVKRLAWRTFNGPRLLSELTIAGPLDLAKKEGTLDLALNGLSLGDWQAFAPGLEPVGSVSAKGQLSARQAGREVAFDLQGTLQGLGAHVGTNRLSQIGLALIAVGQVTNFDRVQLSRTEISITHQMQPAARLSAAGSVGLAPRSASLELGADLDLARLVRILPQPDVQLTAGQIRVSGAQVRQEGTRQTISGGLTLTNLTGRLAGKDLKEFALGSSYDLTATDGKVIDLRRFALYLAETARTKSNHVELSGRIDFSRTNALEGALKLSAQTLDVTPYYDLVANQPATNAASPGRTPSSVPTSTATNAPPEPDPIQLPVRQLVFDARIGQLWLREVEATNVQATVKVEASRVTIRPMALAMNGAPLTGDVDLDLGVRGWRYAVRANAAGLPIAPLADSFVPEYRGRAKGELWADVNIDGGGVTGPSLRKNLVGKLGLSFTNADIQIVGPRLRGFLTPIAAALNAPGLLGSPLKWVAFGGSMGSGKLGLSQLALVSPVFAAATRGEVTLADDLGSSRLGSWPMAFQLDRSLAERLKLAPKDTPTNVALVALPQFITVAGSLSTPKPELDLKALAGSALMKYADKIPGLDERTSGLLKGAAGLLSAPKGGSTNNPAGTNSPAGGLLDFLKRPKTK